MTAQQHSFDRLIAEVIAAEGPQAMPAGFIDRPLAAVAAMRQRYPILRMFDQKAWPTPRALGLAPSTLRVLVLVALVVLAGAAVIVAASLLHRPEPPGSGSLVVWVPDSTGAGVLRFVDGGGTVTRSFDLPRMEGCPQVLPDGQHIAYWAGVYMLGALDGSARTVVRETGGHDDLTALWSPDGWRVAVHYGPLRIVDASNGTVVQPAGAESLVSVAWTPTGELTVARQIDQEVAVQMLDLATSATRELFRFAGNIDQDGRPDRAWSPDGRYLLYTMRTGADVLTFDTQTAASTTVLAGGPGLFDPASAWSRDDRIALVDSDGQVVIARPDGSRVATVRRDDTQGSTYLETKWAPNGASLAITDFEHVVVTTDANGANRQVHQQFHPVGGLAWSPDSTWLAAQIRGPGDGHIAETRVELYSPDGARTMVFGPFTATDDFSGGTRTCLDWEK